MPISTNICAHVYTGAVVPVLLYTILGRENNIQPWTVNIILKCREIYL